MPFENFILSSYNCSSFVLLLEVEQENMCSFSSPHCSQLPLAKREAVNVEKSVAEADKVSFCRLFTDRASESGYGVREDFCTTFMLSCGECKY